MLTHHSSQDYNVAASAAATHARGLMEAKIEEGRAQAGKLIETVHAQVPHDSIVRGSAVNFGPNTEGLLTAQFGGLSMGLHRHALSQVCQKVGAPGQYVAGLSTGAPWEKSLAAQILNEQIHNGHPNERSLVRAVKGEIRGWQSDKYRRLDSRPLLDAFAQECQMVGALPVEGTVTDLRVTLKAFLPHVFEPVPNEVMCLGLEWGNSDFGAAKHSVRLFIWRLWCTNLATMEDVLSQVHLGGRLSEDIQFSDRTYALDTQTSVSALRDTVRAVLSPDKVNTFLQTIKNAHEKQIEWKHVKSALQKKLLKEELKAAEDAFNSQDVINLPPTKSIWRASNAVSWIAKAVEDPTRRLELQRVAGEIVNGKADKIDQILGMVA